MQTEKKNIVPLNIDEMPIMVSLAIREYEKETQPFRKVHRLIDAIEVFIKLHTVCVISRFFEKEEIPDSLKGLLVSGLKTPSLGIWWAFAREFAKKLSETETNDFYKGMIKNLSKGGFLFKNVEGGANLISFRNSYAHGATPKDESCFADIKKYGPILISICENADYFRGISIIGNTLEGECYETQGSILCKTEEVYEGDCCLKISDNSIVSLNPLLVLRKEGNDNHFFFYNDLRKTHVSVLNYEQCLHRKELDLKDDFLKKFPLESWNNSGITAEEKFNDRIELLTETFKGRKKELQVLVDFLSTERGGYLMIWGGPGVGKSALLARANQMLSWSDEVRKDAGINGDIPADKMHIIEYFVRRDMGTNKAEDYLDYMFSRLDNRFKPGISAGKSLKEMDKIVKDQLKIISKKLPDDERIVLIIDGLDEASESPQLLDSLPRELIDKLLVIYASRDNPNIRNAVYDKLEREKHRQMDLGSLTVEDTRALLYEYINKYDLKNGYVEFLTNKSKGNPLYIKLICQGLENNLYTLNDTISLPDELNEIYEKIILRLKESEENGNFFNLLVLLAAGKDYFTIDMLSDVMNLSTLDTKSALNACMEILIENQHAKESKSYQLFHESLREYLSGSFKEDLKKWKMRLSEWCGNWESYSGVSELYALEYGIVHNEELYNINREERKETDADKSKQSMIETIENGKFRKRTFEVCGNDISLKYAFIAIQKILAKTDKDGSSMDRFFLYARMLHEERDKMEKDQLKKIVVDARNGNLGKTAQLAKMGNTAKEKLMLAALALWNCPEKTKSNPELEKAIDEWLLEASDPVLNKLIEKSVKRIGR